MHLVLMYSETIVHWHVGQNIVYQDEMQGIMDDGVFIMLHGREQCAVKRA